KGAEQQITTCKGGTLQIFDNPLANVDNVTLKAIMAGLTFGINKVVPRIFLGILEMNKVMETMRTLIPALNYSIQYNSIGKYNNYICVPEGNKVRKIDKSAYLNPIIQDVDEPSENPS